MACCAILAFFLKLAIFGDNILFVVDINLKPDCKQQPCCLNAQEDNKTRKDHVFCMERINYLVE